MMICHCCSVTKLCPTLWTQGLQHARLLCPLLSSGVCSNSRQFSWWCYLTISFSAIPFSFCLQSFPASGSFPMSQLFASGGQSIGASASASALSMNVRGWFPLGLDWLVWSPCSPRDSQKSSPVPQFRSINSSMLSLIYGPTLTSLLTIGKTIALTMFFILGYTETLHFNSRYFYWFHLFRIMRSMSTRIFFFGLFCLLL